MSSVNDFSSQSLLPRLAAVVGLAFLVVACGGSDNDGAASEEQTSSTAPVTVNITMTNYAYEPSDVSLPAGREVTIQLNNEGSVEHYFVVGETVASDEDGFEQNLFSGVSVEKNKQIKGQDDEGEEDEEEEGSHENVFELPPGSSGSMTFTLPASKAGTYTIACFETTDGEKHYQMGMEGTLTVRPPESE